MATEEQQNGQQPIHSMRGAPLIVLPLTFLLWGFITVLNDSLKVELIQILGISIGKAQYLHYVFFGTYFILAFPASKMIDKLGYKRGIIIGLIIAAVGCLLFLPAANTMSYNLFLFAMFILAVGITTLQVGANPYVALMGKARTAASRLTFVQAFNSVGTLIAPVVAASLISKNPAGAGKSVEDIKAALQSSLMDAFVMPYLILAVLLVIVAIIFGVSTLPEITTKHLDTKLKDDKRQYVLQYKHLVLGAIAIFLYVGAEVSIGAYLVGDYISEGMDMSYSAALASYAAFYWGGAMVGRFIGSVILYEVKPGKAVAFCGIMAAVLVLLAILVPVHIGMWFILAVGLFNSILFPTIFTLGIDGLGRFSEEGSAIMIMAIVGGAIVRYLVGFFDEPQTALIIPLLCYLYIFFYGVRGHKYQAADNVDDY